MFVTPESFLALVSAGIACWLERQAAARIEYLRPRTVLCASDLTDVECSFTDAERRNIAKLTKEVGGNALSNLDPIVATAALLG